MPDFDIDFCKRRRGEVINYVVKKYGHDRVAQIISFGTMAARGAIRDVGRVLGVPYNEVDEIAKMVPFEINITLDKAMHANPKLQKRYDTDPTRQAWSSPTVRSRTMCRSPKTTTTS